MLRRIILGLGANAVGQAVSIVIQLFSLPLYLLYWDLSTYGTWIMLSAVPAYLSMADFGMVYTAGNKMTMAIGRSDVAEANRVFQSAQLFMMIVCGSLAVLLPPLVLFGPLPQFISFDQRVALTALLCQVLLTLFSGLSEQIFRATGRYALGTMMGNLIRLGGWAGAIVGLLLFRNFPGVAICGFLAHAVGACASILLGQRGGHGIHWGTKRASKAEITAMIRPAISFMAFPLANALSFQGVTLLVGALTGTTAVALFNTYRTIARVAVQLTALFSHALWPEFARLFGHGGARAVEALYRRSVMLGAAQSAGLSLLLYFVSPWLLQVWTHGRIAFVPSLMVWMLAYAAISGIWHVPRILLMATNQHIGLAVWSLAAGGLSVTLAWVFGLLWGISGVGAAMLVSEAYIASLCIYFANHSFFQVKSKREYSL
jgi:O-antigen/teichoic acid export membrane protein